MRKDIELAIKNFEVPTFGNKKNFEKLEGMINDDESVIYITPTNATITTMTTRKVEKTPGVFALTSRRILFSKAILLAHSTLTFELSEIKSVNCRGNGILGGHIEILTMVNAIDIIVKYKKIIIEKIQQSFDTAITNYKSALQPGTTNDDNILSQIEKLSGLKDKGILSEQEYLSKKNELLGRL